MKTGKLKAQVRISQMLINYNDEMTKNWEQFQSITTNYIYLTKENQHLLFLQKIDRKVATTCSTEGNCRDRECENKEWKCKKALK